MAGRRGGKDWIGVRKAVKNIYEDLKLGKGNPDHLVSYEKGVPRLKYWFVAPTYGLIKEIVQHIFLFLPDELIQANQTRGNGNKLWLKPDILIEFKSADNPQTLVAAGLNGVYVTETARLKSSVWNDNLRPTLSDLQGWGIFTTTPLPNWYIDEIRALTIEGDKKDPQWTGFFWTTEENTSCPGLAEEVERARKTMPEKNFRRNYLASPNAFQGQIFDDYKRDDHVKTWSVDYKRYRTVVAGVDWGYTHNGSIIVCGIDNDSRIDVIEEVSLPRIPVVSENPTQKTWVTIAKEIQARYKEKRGAEFGVDMWSLAPDEPEHISAFKRNGIFPIKKANNSVSAGIETLGTLFFIDENNHKRIRVHESCKVLISELPRYRWKESGEGGIKEDPVKEDDDSVDALRYCLHSVKNYFKI